MRYVLRFLIGRSDPEQPIDEFEVSRQRRYVDLMSRLNHASVVDHGLVVKNANRAAYRMLVAYALENKLDASTSMDAEFSPKELLRPQLTIPFLQLGEYIDDDPAGVPLNRRREEDVTCGQCGRVSPEAVPNPYLIDERSVRSRRDMYAANNGIIIVSRSFWNAFGDTLRGFVSVGEVAFKPGGPIVGDFICIRPISVNGSELHHSVKSRCTACGGAIIVRRERISDPFLNCLSVVEWLLDPPPPLSLSGNWYGEVSAEHPTDVSRAVFASGAFYSALLTARPKGLVRAKQPVLSLEQAMRLVEKTAD